jgi:hypothetical protein
MDSVQESDHTMTNGEQDTEEKVSKNRSGVFGIVAIFSSVIITLVSLTFSVSDSTKTESAASPYVKARVTLVSDSFRSQGTSAACAGTTSLPNLNKAAVLIGQGSWLSEVPLGPGLLDDQGNCIYSISVLPLSTFTGGNVNLSVRFTFGTSAVKIFNVGDSTPYKIATLQLSFES